MSGEMGVLTYLTDATESHPGEGALCVGDPVVLRQGRRGGKLEAWSANGRRLGALPPAESEALSGLLTGDNDRLRGHIAALVPRPRLTGPGRIHIRVIEQG
ncbi:hypothetical protein GCM10009416_28890 [Craurococcus roseus]|uniref:Uncharacterized protein n=2 Tax=Craurococcus roseus TaxID=77585 RepID=A0ABN1FDN2_9PROT